MKKGRIVAEGPTQDVMNDRILQEVLGENIQTEYTRDGRRVVTPLGRNIDRCSLMSEASEERNVCDARTANGSAN